MLFEPQEFIIFFFCACFLQLIYLFEEGNFGRKKMLIFKFKIIILYLL